MTEFDRSKALQELENEDWGEPNFDSHLVQECHRLSRVPLQDFTAENLRIMIGQNFGLDYLIPLAVEKLEENPLIEGGFYAGDLLANVLRADSSFWSKFPELKSKVARIADDAFEISTITKIEFESIRDAFSSFIGTSASPR